VPIPAVVGTTSGAGRDELTSAAIVAPDPRWRRLAPVAGATATASPAAAAAGAAAMVGSASAVAEVSSAIGPLSAATAARPGEPVDG
jgi:hypothetical protein